MIPQDKDEPMTWTESFTCNICGKSKGSVDHWWVAWIETVQPSDVESPKPKFQLLPWSELMARHPEVAHLCGMGCALKEAERWMTNTAESSRSLDRAMERKVGS
jgi:hypothetical protein